MIVQFSTQKFYIRIPEWRISLHSRKNLICGCNYTNMNDQLETITLQNNAQTARECRGENSWKLFRSEWCESNQLSRAPTLRILLLWWRRDGKYMRGCILADGFLLKKIYGNQYTTNTSVNFLLLRIHFRLNDYRKVLYMLCIFFYFKTNLGESKVAGWKERALYCGCFLFLAQEESCCWVMDYVFFVRSITHSELTIPLLLLYFLYKEFIYYKQKWWHIYVTFITQAVCSF